MYVGTGEPNRSSDSFFGIGIKVAKGPATTDPLDPRVSPWSLEAPDLASKAIYRLAPDPATAGVVYAATTVGLWRRTLDANGLPQWAKVFDPAAAASGCSWLDFLGSSSSQQAPQIYVTDVAIGPAAGGNPQTIYAAVQDVGGQTPQQVWASQSGNDGSWQAVPGFTATDRVALAVSPTDPSVVYALSRGTEPAAGSGTTAVPTNLAKLVNGTFQPVGNAPTNLMGEAGRSQSFYDTVIAVDPVDPSVIWLGGSAMLNPATQDYNASLFRGQVTAGATAGTWSFGFTAANANTPAKDPTWVGSGAHPDMHAIAFSGPAAAPTVWVGCDGGVFQSTVVTPAPAGAQGTANNTAPGPWLALNNGLAITQPNYLAQTSVSDYLLLAGTQDNGTQEHTGSAVWTVAAEGDGGGVAIDDANPSRRFAQYTGFTWYTVGAPGRGYTQTLDYYQGGHAAQPLLNAWQTENKYSAFYSQAAARPLASGATALAFGSHRVWYCEDWGQAWVPGAPAANSWRTLPTGTTNPFEKTNNAGNPAPDQNQDSLHSQVVRVAFADDNQLLVLAQAWPYDPLPRPAGSGRALPAHPGWPAVDPGLAEPARRRASPRRRTHRRARPTSSRKARYPSASPSTSRARRLPATSRSAPARTRRTRPSTTSGGTTARTGGRASSTRPSPTRRSTPSSSTPTARSTSAPTLASGKACRTLAAPLRRGCGPSSPTACRKPRSWTSCCPRTRTCYEPPPTAAASGS